ncbi:MAG TPA: GrpB family protein [Thermomicrobiales bacterium]|nr:GrpB family protein [Thermomicrobiales bacterium]
MGKTIRPGWDTGDWLGMPPVTIHSYDPEWVERYERARQDIEQALAGLDVRIEHIGSTAVPGLGARNGIDIQIGVSSPAGMDECAERLRLDGFSHHFTKPEHAHLSGKGCKLHIMPVDCAGWPEMLLFRDYLRQHPETLGAYDRLKRDLARQHGMDGGKYVDGTRAFVLAVVEQALQDASRTATEPAAH